MSGPADSKSVPGFDNWPRFVGVIEQNKISDSFDKYCITLHFFVPEFLELFFTPKNTPPKFRNSMSLKVTNFGHVS